MPHRNTSRGEGKRMKRVAEERRIRHDAHNKFHRELSKKINQAKGNNHGS